jgi:hypothetical protein
MDTKLIAMILGVALVLATAATVYTQLAFAAAAGGGGGGGGGGAGRGAGGGNGVTDGQTAHGLGNACSHPNVAAHNPNCGQTATGAARTATNTNNGGNAATG